MADTEIELYFEGEGADDLAWELARRIEKRLGAPVRVQRPPSAQPSRDLALAVGIISLVVSLPGAVMSTAQVVEWWQKRKKASATVAPEGLKIRIAIPGTGVSEPLDAAGVEAMIEDLGRDARPAGDDRNV